MRVRVRALKQTNRPPVHFLKRSNPSSMKELLAWAAKGTGVGGCLLGVFDEDVAGSLGEAWGKAVNSSRSLSTRDIGPSPGARRTGGRRPVHGTRCPLLCQLAVVPVHAACFPAPASFPPEAAA